jgi:hypothetical protein
MEFFSAIKKNEVLSFADKWMELENIILIEVSQVQKTKGPCFLSYVEYRSNTNKQHYVYIAIFRDHVPLSVTW